MKFRPMMIAGIHLPRKITDLYLLIKVQFGFQKATIILIIQHTMEGLPMRLKQMNYCLEHTSFCLILGVNIQENYTILSI